MILVQVQEDIAWESPYGVLTVYERRIRMQDDDGGGGGPDGNGGGGGGGNSDDYPPLVGGLKKVGSLYLQLLHGADMCETGGQSCQVACSWISLGEF